MKSNHAFYSDAGFAGSLGPAALGAGKRERYAHKDITQ